MKYKSLNDAAKHVSDPGFAKGQTRIWYMRPESFREYIAGYDWLRDQGIPIPDPKTIGQTHIKLGSIKEADLDRVFSMLQGESWSPRGEARDLIRDLGLGHTSISVGDIVQTADGELLMVDSHGFRSLHKPRGANPDGAAPDNTLSTLVRTAETEAQRAAETSDAGEAVQGAITAAYHSGAAAYIARRVGDAKALKRAQRVFFDVYRLAQATCGPAQAKVPNPSVREIWREAFGGKHPKEPKRSGGHEGIQKAHEDTVRALAAARRAEDISTRIGHASEAMLHAGAMWAFAVDESEDPGKAKHWRETVAPGAMAKADRFADAANELIRESLGALGDQRWTHVSRQANPEMLKRRLMR